jgi:excisionase family DNA binding protein
VKRLAYRISELADALGVPASTIRGWIARREIASRRIGRVVLVPAAELERLLGTPEPGAPARAPEVRREASKLLSGMVGP